MAVSTLRLVLFAITGVACGVALTLWLGSAGLNVIVIGLGASVSALVAYRSLPRRGRPLLPSFALQGGYTFWLLFGALALGRWGGLFDVVPLLAGLIWLGRELTRRPAVFLVAVHGVELLLLVAQLGPSATATDTFNLFLVHATIRAAGVYLMVRGLNTMWRRESRRVERFRA